MKVQLLGCVSTACPHHVGSQVKPGICLSEQISLASTALSIMHTHALFCSACPLQTQTQPGRPPQQQCRSIEGALKAAAAMGADSAPRQPAQGNALANPAWAPSSTVGIVKPPPMVVSAAVAGGQGGGDGKEGKPASRVETPTATPTVTPRESVESAEDSAAVAAAAAVQDVKGGGGVARPECTTAATAAVTTTEKAESTKVAGGTVVDAADRAAAAEAVAEGLQAQLQEMKVRSPLARGCCGRISDEHSQVFGSIASTGESTCSVVFPGSVYRI